MYAQRLTNVHTTSAANLVTVSMLDACQPVSGVLAFVWWSSYTGSAAPSVQPGSGTTGMDTSGETNGNGKKRAARFSKPKKAMIVPRDPLGNVVFPLRVGKVSPKMVAFEREIDCSSFTLSYC